MENQKGKRRKKINNWSIELIGFFFAHRLSVLESSNKYGKMIVKTIQTFSKMNGQLRSVTARGMSQMKFSNPKKKIKYSRFDSHQFFHQIREINPIYVCYRFIYVPFSF